MENKKIKGIAIILALIAAMMAAFSATAYAEDTVTFKTFPIISIKFANATDTTSLDADLYLVTGTAQTPKAIVRVDTGTQGDTYFEYKPAAKLSQGTYNFTISAKDLQGNTGITKQKTFIVSYADMDIVMTKPNPYGYSSLTQFLLEVESDRQSSCKWNKIDPTIPYTSSLWQAFENTDGYKHSISKYNLTTQQEFFYAACLDSETGNTFAQTFILTLDQTIPAITDLYTNYDNNIITDTISPEFFLLMNAPTDEPVQCRYSRTQNFAFEQGVMFDSSYYGHTNESITLVNPAFYPTTTAPTTIYVKCRNLAGLISDQKTITISYNPNTPLSITGITSPIYIQTSSFLINVTLNKYDAFCKYYDNQNYQGEGNTFIPYMLSRTQYATGNVPGQGAYNYYVRCQDSLGAATATATVIYDNTAPTMLSVSLIAPNSSYPTKTYYDDRLEARLTARDDQSGIAAFNYYVLRKPNDVVIDSGTITGGIESAEGNATIFVFEGTISGLELNDTYTYALKANAVDRAGKISTQNMTSNNTMTVDLSLRPQTCNDGIKNGGESDVDCGGSCSGCGTGEDCVSDEDCDSNVCTNETCAAASCFDNVKNGDETDVDCGGNCARNCLPGKKCRADRDCTSGECEDDKCVEPENLCRNSQLDPGEGGIDCGGLCPDKCAAGSQCTRLEDCESNVCTAGICQAASCTDRVLNGQESSLDCGGATCPKCANGAACRVPSDCQSGYCTSGTCQESVTVITTPPPTYPEEEEEGIGWLWILIIIIILLILAAGGYLAYQKWQESQKKMPPKGMPPMRMPQRPMPGMPQRPPMRPGMTPAMLARRREEETRRTTLFRTFGAEKPAEKKEEAKAEKEGPDDVFEQLSNLKAYHSPKQRDEVFGRLKGMPGAQVRPKHIKKVVESENREIKDLIKTFNIIADKRINDDVGNEIIKSLDNLSESNKQMKSEFKKVASKLTPKPGPVIASKTGGKFHKPTCIAAKNITKPSQVAFKDRKEAMAKGYKPCSVCNS